MLVGFQHKFRSCLVYNHQSLLTNTSRQSIGTWVSPHNVDRSVSPPVKLALQIPDDFFIIFDHVTFFLPPTVVMSAHRTMTFRVFSLTK